MIHELLLFSNNVTVMYKLVYPLTLLFSIPIFFIIILSITFIVDYFMIQRVGSSCPQIPTRSSVEAAGYDIYTPSPIIIPAWSRSLVSTGLRFVIPHGCYARIAPRSGLSLLGLDIAAGVIDRDYCGEVKIMVVNNSNTELEIPTGSRFCQVVLEKIQTPMIRLLNSSDVTTKCLNRIYERGEKGFGEFSGLF